MTNDGIRPRRSRLGFHLAVWLLAMVLVGMRLEPPAPRYDAPAHAFAAGRALAVLRHLLGDERPHPRGSEANREVRARIEAELRRLGLEPRVDRVLGCRDARCAPVENVVATIRGKEPRDGRDAVLLACHYDSVPTGPGASDDGAGVAALLEVARALVEGQGVDRDVVLLFDDGEEQGLLGADAFVRTAPELGRVGVVVNVEARGTTGPSLLFEVQHARLGAIRTMARALERPVTSSLFGGVYERMPNDTDLSVFGRANLLGFNFAFIRGLEHYHRTTDDLAHLDPASLQHHGEQLLAMTRAFGHRATVLSSDIDEPRAVWFDVLAGFVVVWPESFSLPLASLSLAIGLFARRRGIPGGRMIVGLSVASALVALTFVPASYLLLAPLAVAVVGLVATAFVPDRLRQRVAFGAALATTFVGGVLGGEVLFGLRDVFF
jgi:hypothetical protein